MRLSTAVLVGALVALLHPSSYTGDSGYGGIAVTSAKTFDFSQYKTCQECTKAGFGWCPIQRLCGGFANSNCGSGPQYHRADYNPAAEEKKKKEQKERKKKAAEEKKNEKRNDLVHYFSAKDFASTVRVSRDYWCIYFRSPTSTEIGGGGNEQSLSPEQFKHFALSSKRIGLRFGVVDIEKEKDSIIFKGDMFPSTLTLATSVVLYLDNRLSPPQLLLDGTTNSSVLSSIAEEPIARWVLNEVSSAVIRRVNGEEKKRRDAVEAARLADKKQAAGDNDVKRKPVNRATHTEQPKATTKDATNKAVADDPLNDEF